MSKVILTETLKHKQAFEIYYALGECRSYNKTAKKLKVSQQSVKKWSASFGWQDRLYERDMEIAAQLKDATDRTIVEQRLIYLDIIRKMVDDFKIEVAQGGVALANISDFERLIKLDLLLSGSPTEILQVDLFEFEEKIKSLDNRQRVKFRNHVVNGGNPLGFFDAEA